MICMLFYAVVIILIAICGDRLTIVADYYVYKAFIDTITHGFIGLFSWLALVSTKVPFRHFNLKFYFEAVICGGIASLIDLDHFIAAKTLNLKVALQLNKRPPFHSSSLLILIILALHLFAKVFRNDWIFKLGWIIFIAGGSHHIRDAVRRGLWFPPFGSTPPLHKILYLGLLAIFPHFTALFLSSSTISKKSTFITV